MENVRYKWYQYKYKKLNRGNVKPFNLSKMHKFCKVVDIMDGQTVIIIMDYNGKTHKWHLRMDKYKTYVLSDVNKVEPHQKRIIVNSACKSAEHLISLIEKVPDKIFKVKINGYNAKGLLIGELYYFNNPISINAIMVRNNYGVPYVNPPTYLNH